ncbi:hypothetical protein FS749_012565, partial [Ceratobasidium sp. UAMH 11750]
MAPRVKSHRTLGASSRTHSTASLHKAHDGQRLAGLTTINKDDRKGNHPRDSLVKAKKHSSSSSALSAKRNASRTNVQRTSSARTTSADKDLDPPMENPKAQPDDEGWVSSESGVATPVNQENENDDDDDSELDDDEILQLQTQRANRNAREAERLKAAMIAAEAELRAQRKDASITPPARESPRKHTNISPARPPTPPADPKPQPSAPRQQSPLKQPPSTAPIAPQPHIEDHTKHTFPTQHTPSPPP